MAHQRAANQGTAPRLRLATTATPQLLDPHIVAMQVVPWRDPFVEQIGHDPRGDYVERFWLSVLGPSTTWLVRTLSWGFAASPDGFVLDLPGTARALGMSERMGRNSPFHRTLIRACQFDIAQMEQTHTSGRTVISARLRMPWLSRRLVSTLPVQLRLEHQQWLEAAALA